MKNLIRNFLLICFFIFINSIYIYSTKNEDPLSLHKAAQDGDIAKIKELLKNGYNINIKNDYNETPLHYASYFGRYKTVKFLVDNGAEVNVKSIEGWYPLHSAVKNNKYDVVKYLVAKGAFLDGQNNNGNTPLHLALINKNTEIALYLIYNYSDIYKLNNEYARPVDILKSLNISYNEKLLKKYHNITYYNLELENLNDIEPYNNDYLIYEFDGQLPLFITNTKAVNLDNFELIKPDLIDDYMAEYMNGYDFNLLVSVKWNGTRSIDSITTYYNYAASIGVVERTYKFDQNGYLSGIDTDEQTYTQFPIKVEYLKNKIKVTDEIEYYQGCTGEHSILIYEIEISSDNKVVSYTNKLDKWEIRDPNCP